MANPKGSFYQNLSDSEKRYVIGAAIFFPTLIMVVALIVFVQSIGEVETETQRYKDSLDLLATAAPVYLEQKKNAQQATSHKKLDDEMMANNDIKLTSFVAGHASKADITVSSYDEDELPFGSKDNDEGPIIVEQQLRVEIREASMANLVKLMDFIEKDTKPVFIKRIDIRKRGRDAGEVRAILTVSTFVKKEKES
jgi:hypothetical protein